jgi:sensor histidine kinase YesM
MSNTLSATPSFKIPEFFRRRWVQHALFWTIYVVTTLVSDSRTWIAIPDDYPGLFLATNLVSVPLTYALTLWAIPRLLYRGRWSAFLVASAALVVGACFVMYFASIPVMESIYKKSPELGQDAISAVDFLGLNVLFLFLVLGLKVAKDAWMADHNRQERERLLLAEELNQLRAQIGPHFLLNSLNTVYGLSITAPAEVPDTVLRLADLLRFTLYEARHQDVPLTAELQFLADYIGLQRMRASEKLALDVQLPTSVDSNVRIAPLLLIVFLENAFKFAQANADGARFLTIQCSLDSDARGDRLDFRVQNAYQAGAPAHAEEAKLPAETGGVGLQNVRRRLALLYPGRHGLQVEGVEGVFSVHLQLNLRS